MNASYNCAKINQIKAVSSHWFAYGNFYSFSCFFSFMFCCKAFDMQQEEKTVPRKIRLQGTYAAGQFGNWWKTIDATFDHF